MEKEKNAKTEEEASEETGKIQVAFSIFPFVDWSNRVRMLCFS